MGRLILCKGKLATMPYHFTLTNTNIYSIEELCYYLYNNIYAIYEDTFQEELVTWLREELDLPEISIKLKELIHNKNSLKDIIVTLLCASDYYSEDEITDIIHIIDEIGDLEPIRRQKIKADHYLKYKCYQFAEKDYSNILSSKDISLLSEREYGDIIHNQAVIKLHTASVREAANTFKEAYKYNQDEETLKEYLYSLKIGGFANEYEEEITNYNLSPEIFFELNEDMKDALTQIEESPNFLKFKKLVFLKNEGKLNEFYKGVDEVIYEWKREYRTN